MFKSGIAALLFLLSSSTHAAPLTAADRKDIEKQTYTTCVDKQLKAPENANITAKQISNFCDCVSETLANTVTSADAEKLQQGDKSAIINKSLKAYGYCLPAAQR